MTHTVAFDRVPIESRLRTAELVGREWLTDGYVRIRLAGSDLRGFAAPGGDDHVRLFLVPVGADVPATPEEWRELPSREYTPVNADAEAGWVEFDFVIHGDGPGSAWAAQAPIGAPVAVGGPRRSTTVTGEPDAWFLAGDETAVPAITRFLRLRRPGTTARVILEVAPENELLPFAADPACAVTLVVRGDHSLTEALKALGEGDRPAGAVIAFVAAEASVVPVARELLLDRWGLPSDAVIAKGYWRRD